MAAARRSFNAILLLVPLLLVMGGAAAYVRSATRAIFIDTRLAEVVATAATRVVGRPVHIGALHVTFNPLTPNRPATIHAYHVGLAGVGSADGIAFSLPVTALVAGGRPDPYIDVLTVTGPRATLERDRAGIWNVSGLFKTAPQRRTRLIGRVIVHGGTIRYVDQARGRSAFFARPVSSRATAVAAVIDFLPDGSTAFRGTCSGPDGYARELNAAGTWHADAGGLVASVTVREASLPAVIPAVTAQRSVLVDSGVASGVLDLSVPNTRGSPARIGIDAAVEHGSLGSNVYGLRASGLAGTVALGPGSVACRLHGSMAGGTVDVNLDLANGHVGWNWLDDAQLSGTARFGNTDLAGLARTLAGHVPAARAMQPLVQHLGGTGTVGARLAGTLTHPAVQVVADVPRAAYRGVIATGIRATSSYAGGQWRATASASVLGGTMHAGLEGKPRSYRLALSARGCDLRSARGLTHLALTGSVDADCMVAYNGRRPVVTFMVDGRRVRYPGYPIAGLAASGTLDGDLLRITRADAVTAVGEATANGLIHVQSKSMDLNTSVAGFDVGYVDRFLGGRPLPPYRLPPAGAAWALLTRPPGYSLAPSTVSPTTGGFAFAAGRLTGNRQAWRWQGDAACYALTYRGLSVDSVAAHVDATRRQVALTGISAERGNARASGDALLSGIGAPTPRLAVTGTVSGLDLGDTAAALMPSGAPDVAGVLSVDHFALTGPINSLTSIGPARVTVADAEVNGEALDNVEGTATMAAGVFHLDTGQIGVAGGTLTVHASVTPAGGLSGQMGASGIDLSRVVAWVAKGSGPSVSGTASVTASVAGQVSDPHVAVLADAPALTVNGAGLGHAVVRGTLSRTGLSDGAVDMHLPDGGLARAAQVTVIWPDRTVGGHATVTGLTVATVRNALRSMTPDIDPAAPGWGTRTSGALAQLEGALSADADVRGTLDEPLVHISWSSPGLTYDQFRATAFAGTADVSRRETRVPEAHLDLAGLGSELVASNVDAVYDGALSGTLSAYGVDLSVLNQLVPGGARSGPAAHAGGGWIGSGDLTVDAGGTTRSPDLVLSANLRDVSWRDPAARLKYPTIDHIDVDSLRLREGEATGTVRLLTKSREPGKMVDLGFHGTAGFTWHVPVIGTDSTIAAGTGLNAGGSAGISLGDAADLLRLADAALGVPAGGGVSLLGASRGSVAVSGEMTGTMGDPALAGVATVDIPALHIPGYRTGLANLKGSIKLADDRIVIADGFSAASAIFAPDGQQPLRMGAPIQVAGSLPLSPRAGSGGAVTLSAPRVLFDEEPVPGAATGVVRGAVSLSGVRITGSVQRPRVSGTAVVSDTLVQLPDQFLNTSTPGVNGPEIPILDLAVQLGSNVMLQNPAISARVGGTVTVRGTPADPSLQGTLALSNGKFRLPTATFTLLDPATLSLLYPVYDISAFDAPALQVVANIRAQTFINATSIGGVPKRYRVIVTARGSLTNDSPSGEEFGQPLQLTFETDPADLAIGQAALNQRLTGILGGLDALTGLSRNPAQALVQQLTTVLSGSVLPGILDRTAARLGLESLSVGYDPLQRLTLSVGRRIGGPIYATYYRTLTGNQEEYDLKFSFRFNARYQLSYNFSNADIQQVLLEGVWRF